MARWRTSGGTDTSTVSTPIPWIYGWTSVSYAVRYSNRSIPRFAQTALTRSMREPGDAVIARTRALAPSRLERPRATYGYSPTARWASSNTMSENEDRSRSPFTRSWWITWGVATTTWGGWSRSARRSGAIVPVRTRGGAENRVSSTERACWTPRGRGGARKG